jgi:general secretion pathway protein H
MCSPWALTASLAAKAKTPTSAAGNKPSLAMQRQHGLTLLELLVVLAIIALATVGVSLSMRDGRQTQIEREAQRLIAVLEASRTQSRTSGVVMVWQPNPQGFAIQTLPARPTQPPVLHAWLHANTQAQTQVLAATGQPANERTNESANASVVLGPEPIIPAARITLTQPPFSVTVGTDGLRPFAMLP